MNTLFLFNGIQCFAVNTHWLMLDKCMSELRSKELTKVSRIREIREIDLSDKMHSELLLLCSVWFFSVLDCTLSTNKVTWQNFQLSQAGNNQCPGPEGAFQSLIAKSRIQCAVECNISSRCIDFSYYSSSRRCYLYSFLPSKVSYDKDCNFMMVSFKYFSSMKFRRCAAKTFLKSCADV